MTKGTVFWISLATSLAVTATGLAVNNRVRIPLIAPPKKKAPAGTP